MNRIDDFDTQIQCEELFPGEGLMAQLQWMDYLKGKDAAQALRESEDVMDCCEIVSLDTIKHLKCFPQIDEDPVDYLELH